MATQIKSTKNVSQAIVDAARKHAEAGKTKAQVKGFLLMEGVNEAECADILRNLGLTRQMGGFRDWLYAELAKGPMTKETFKAQIKDATENARRHESHYWGIVELVNKVHAKAKAAK